MRKIEFRGKRIDNGEWVRGYYMAIAGTHKILSPNPDSPSGATYYDVDPYTVGQNTGLKDRRWQDIYEGDILHTIGVNSLTQGKHYYRTVLFENGTFSMRIEDCGISSPLHNHIEIATLNWDVVGNIHDNPQMLPKYCK